MKTENKETRRGSCKKAEGPIVGEAEGMMNLNLKGMKYIGTCQYRRRLEFAEDTDFKKIFKEHDIILPKPLVMGVPVALQYGACHNIEDIKSMEAIVKDLYPDYADDWDKHINKGNIIYYSSGMVMKKKDFIKYCKWLFPLFDEFKKRHDINSVEDARKYVEANIKAGKHKSTRGIDYQMQLFGFLQERLFTLYVKHNFKTPLEIPYKKFENIGII